MRVSGSWVLLALALTAGTPGCSVASSSAGASTEPARAPHADPAPIAPPRASITGCVESRELAEYVQALDALRSQARTHALAELNAVSETRRGVLADTGARVPLDTLEDAAGRRRVVAAWLAPEFAPAATLARQGTLLYRLEERPRAHAVDLLVCGVARCTPPARTGAPPPSNARPLWVELSPDERWGNALGVSYDYWWARVRYDRSEACPSAG